ncbi:MAG TPA: peptide-methionine (R)-S-oxide reductase MsrB [Candidatus Paceibacterota bacterium]|nr:peptide-methionine (R)-S-oxide reductase MsrB [Candidatus Paceibacterota bacterium]
MTEDDFKEKLNPEQYRVMREKDTERPYSGRYWDHEEKGIYLCAACNNPLFTSLSKFDSETGWPSFARPAKKSHLTEIAASGGRTEVTCSKCGGHLGYLLSRTPGEKPYYQVNSASLKFLDMPELDDEDDSDQDEDNQDGSQKNASKVKGNPQTASKVKLPTISLQNMLFLVAAALAGGVLGGSYGAYLCQTSSPIVAGSSISSPVPVSTSSILLAPSTPKKLPKSAASNLSSSSSSSTSSNLSSPITATSATATGTKGTP